MKRTFNNAPPNVHGPAVAAFRTGNDTDVLDALKALKALDGEVEAEVIALAYAHPEAGVRKKAMSLVKKHVASAADIKAVLKIFRNAHGGDDRLRDLEYARKKELARAMTYHAWMGTGTAFVLDDEVRAILLEQCVERAEREDEDILILDEFWQNWKGSHGSTANPGFHRLPEGFAKKLNGLQKRRQFRGIRLHAVDLEDLPADFASCASWMKSLQLSCNDFTTLPEVILKLKNLEELIIWGHELEDLPDLRPLKKLWRLDIGNSTKMKTIPESVCQNDQLKELRIGNGKIRKVPDAIAGMTSLERFGMQSANVRKLPNAFFELPAIEEVRVRYSGVAADAVKARFRDAGRKVTVEG